MEERIHVMLYKYKAKHTLFAYPLESSGDHAIQVLCVHSYLSELLYEQHSFEL